MTNQTIDGVPRELLERVATEADHMLGFTYASNSEECRSAVDELRALLDAKRCNSCDDSGDLIDLTGEWRGYCVCPVGVALKNKPAAQPQGNTVTFPRDLSDELAELIAEKARVCGGGAFDIWEAICEQFGSPAEQPAPAAVAIPDECPHLIVFDDADRGNMLFAGSGARSAALKTWEKISMSWNAHLFVRVDRNCRDDRYPSASTI